MTTPQTNPKDLRTEDTEDIYLIYVGQRLSLSSVNNKPIHYWIKTTREGFEEGVLPDGPISTSYEGKNPVKYMTGGPGAVYKVQQIVGKDSIISTTARYVGLWPDVEKRMEWQADHRIVVTQNDVRKRENKECDEDNFSQLKPFREKYGRLISQNQRAALLAQIIAYITRG